MDQGLIARRYAKAILEVAQEKGQASEMYRLMETMVDSAVAQPGLSETLANPFVPSADKEMLLLNAAGVSKADDAPLFADFLNLLSQNGRMDFAAEIGRAFCRLYREQNHIFKVKVTSAAPLEQQTRDRLVDMIQKQVGQGSVDCTFSVDPALIGGFTIDMGSERLDASVKKQLADLRLNLLEH